MDPKKPIKKTRGGNQGNNYANSFDLIKSLEKFSQKDDSGLERWDRKLFISRMKKTLINN